MTIHQDRLGYLLHRYQLKQISWEEMQELFANINDGGNELVVQQFLGEKLDNTAVDSTPVPVDWEFMFRYVTQEEKTVESPGSIHFMKRTWWAAAAVIVLAGLTAIWLLTGRPASVPETVSADRTQTIIQPGRNGAMLTLSDGSTVLLDTIRNGVVALQGGSRAKVVNGILVYEKTGDEIAFNTMSTPKGRQYQLALPDGTKVWLNAASSIRFPTVFAGKDRSVHLSGEAYFEVAKNREMPFRVIARNNAEVEVLGTHFNVCAYDNETMINTTLLEGSVRMNPISTAANMADPGMVLKPGQQGRLSVTEKAPVQLMENVDTDKVMAWKNGLFNFEEASLQEIMKQLERWYDIEVVYEKNIPEIALTGKITRGVTLNKLLPALAKMGLHYKLEGRKLILLP
ncbi:FecR family protein [Pseudobacter ginsenosidimutans]|uniref:FecR family protein n=1 Tax=Pseudobacter ginsenosidimutans TaxID=661488 RepID=A0A4Q7MNI9_9BACT|nr:FecR family protein [Pseudobacter ginsenosidimutans]QEC40254.1 DUF4974 domain-containing protein [Pseudobacter ginsenosidimutans]RZS69148.1 FecR family protein [Pseudobacter ginsenosidimutans]